MGRGYFPSPSRYASQFERTRGSLRDFRSAEEPEDRPFLGRTHPQRPAVTFPEMANYDNYVSNCAAWAGAHPPPPLLRSLALIPGRCLNLACINHQFNYYSRRAWTRAIIYGCGEISGFFSLGKKLDREWNISTFMAFRVASSAL